MQIQGLPGIISLKIMIVIIIIVHRTLTYNTNIWGMRGWQHSLGATPFTREEGSGTLRITDLFCIVSKCGPVKYVLTKDRQR